MTTLDPSAERDLAAKDKATERSDDAGVKFDELERKVHRLLGEVAANTSLTLGTADDIKAMKTEIAKVDFGRLADMVDAIETMKGGVKVLGWLERPAKWLAAMLGLAAAIWALWHSTGGK